MLTFFSANKYGKWGREVIQQMCEIMSGRDQSFSLYPGSKGHKAAILHRAGSYLAQHLPQYVVSEGTWKKLRAWYASWKIHSGLQIHGNSILLEMSLSWKWLNIENPWGKHSHVFAMFLHSSKMYAFSVCEKKNMELDGILIWCNTYPYRLLHVTPVPSDSVVFSPQVFC